MNFSFYTAHICENTSRANGLLQPGEALQIVVHCSTEEDIVTEGKAGVTFRAGNIYNAVKDRVLQHIFCTIIGQNLISRVKFSYCFGNGAADKPQTDKTNGCGFHVF